MHLGVERSKNAEGSLGTLDFKYRCSLGNKLILGMYAHVLTVLNSPHRMQTSTAAMENSVKISEKTGNRTAI